MTALVDSGHAPQKNFPFNNLRTTDLRFKSQAFGREPNGWFDRDGYDKPQKLAPQLISRRLR